MQGTNESLNKRNRVKRTITIPPKTEGGSEWTLKETIMPHTALEGTTKRGGHTGDTAKSKTVGGEKSGKNSVQGV